MVKKLNTSVGKAYSPSPHSYPQNRMTQRYPDVFINVSENITVGERVSIGSGVVLSADSPIVIGNDTMIAARAIINTATHSYHNYPMWKERISRPINIGSNVWIGSNAIILPGIKIGNYAVIGAGSVVTKHVPEKAVVAGNPAHIIRFRELSEEDPSAIYPGKARYEDFLPDDHTL